MNPDLSHHSREELEAGLTALLLGELPPEQAEALRRAIEQDAALAALHQRLKLTIDLVRETARQPAEQTAVPPASLKLSEGRRQKLLAHFKTVTPKEFVPPRLVRLRGRQWRSPALLAAAAGLVGLLALAVLLRGVSVGRRAPAAGNPVKLAYDNAKAVAVRGRPLGPQGREAKRERLAELADGGRTVESINRPSRLGRELLEKLTNGGPASKQESGGARYGGGAYGGYSSVTPDGMALARGESAGFVQVPNLGTVPIIKPAPVPGQSAEAGKSLVRAYALSPSAAPAPPAAPAATALARAASPEAGRQPPASTLANRTEIVLPPSALAGEIGGQTQPPGSAAAEQKTFSLQHAEPNQLADQISPIFPDASRPDSAPGFGFRFGGQGGPFGDGGNGKGTSDNRDQKLNKVSAIPEPPTRSITVTAPAQVMPHVSEMVRQLDSDARHEQVKVFELANAAPQDVKQILEELFQRSGNTPAGGARNQRNSLVVPGKPLTQRQTQNQGAAYSGAGYVADTMPLAQRQTQNQGAPGGLSPGSASNVAGGVGFMGGGMGGGMIGGGLGGGGARVGSTTSSPYPSNTTIGDAYFSLSPDSRRVARTAGSQSNSPSEPAPAQTAAGTSQWTVVSAGLSALSEPAPTQTAAGTVNLSFGRAAESESQELREHEVGDYFNGVGGIVFPERLRASKLALNEAAAAPPGQPSAPVPPAAASPLFVQEGVRQGSAFSDVPRQSLKAAKPAAQPAQLEGNVHSLSALTAAALVPSVAPADSNALAQRVDSQTPLEDQIPILGDKPIIGQALRRKIEAAAKEKAARKEQGLAVSTLDSLDSEGQASAPQDKRIAGTPTAPASSQVAGKDLSQLGRTNAIVGHFAYVVPSGARAEGELREVQKALPAADSASGKLPSEDVELIARNERDLASRRPANASPPDGVEADSAKKRPSAPAPVPQPEVQTRENAFSTFSLNVSDVSFKLAAANLEKGLMPEPAAVRSEEFINAFDYRDAEAPAGVPVAFAFERARWPFAQNRDLVRFSLKTAARGRQAGRPLNLVLLLDTSGSMERADRVRIVHEALRVLAAQLEPLDMLSVVTFARTARLWVDGVPGSQAGKVAEELSGLTPQGGTNLEEAMNLAYQTALRHYLANGINRVVLLTDGAANLGNVEPEVLKRQVEAHRKQGVVLDCFGIGWEGYNDDLLEVLSRGGDGRYGFLNTPEEAVTEFAGQLAGALRPAASDVKVQVEFNPARVRAWRQMGYARHQLAKEQFRDNTVAAAELGAAEAGNALYVLETEPRGDGPLGVVRVRYRLPGTGAYREQEWTVPYTGSPAPLEQASPALRLAAVAGAFSEWLASSPFAGEVTLDRLLAYLRGVPEVYRPDARPGKLEWMLRQAQSLGGK